jgi:hypothetical protein
MPKRLLLLNGVFVIVSVLCVLYIARQFMTPTAIPVGPRSRPAPAGPTVQRPAEGSRPPAAAYTVVSARNLFSPTRTEAPPTAFAGPVVPLVKPNLYGVVLREGAPLAYLEDPATKRVAGYRIGDSISGGTIEAINSDSVVITRPEGKVDVRLRDPGKPRPTATAGATPPIPGAAGVAGAQPPAPAASLPGVIPPTPTMPSTAAAPPGVQGQPGQAVPPTVPGRRVLPPNLLRRFPQAPANDATQQ